MHGRNIAGVGAFFYDTLHGQLFRLGRIRERRYDAGGIALLGRVARVALAHHQCRYTDFV